MGINGLLPFVQPATKRVHISELKGKKVAIDSYCWLHKGVFSCAEKIVKGEDTDAYISYCCKYLDMLCSFQIKPVMVFDGKNLPAKAATEKNRYESRARARKRAIECLNLGKFAEARINFVKAVDVTPEMALKLIKVCRSKHIDCIVAPYEADAQLAYLNMSKIVDIVISEDSDLLVFGCTKVLFKLDISGHGNLVEGDKLHLAMQINPESFSLDRFRWMCILSGCDYLDSLPGIGLKKSLKFIKTLTNSSNIYDALLKLPIILNMKNIVVTKDYRDKFMIADATFKHQFIFDLPKRCMKPLTDIDASGTKIEYCVNAGSSMDHAVAYQIALGNINPHTLCVLDNWCPDKVSLGHFSFTKGIWAETKCTRKLIEWNSPKISCGMSEIKPGVSSADEAFKVEEAENKFKTQMTKMYLENSPTVSSISPIKSALILKRAWNSNPFLRRDTNEIVSSGESEPAHSSSVLAKFTASSTKRQRIKLNRDWLNVPPTQLNNAMGPEKNHPEQNKLLALTNSRPTNSVMNDESESKDFSSDDHKCQYQPTCVCLTGRSCEIIGGNGPTQKPPADSGQMTNADIVNSEVLSLTNFEETVIVDGSPGKVQSNSFNDASLLQNQDGDSFSEQEINIRKKISCFRRTMVKDVGTSTCPYFCGLESSNQKYELNARLNEIVVNVGDGNKKLIFSVQQCSKKAVKLQKNQPTITSMFKRCTKQLPVSTVEDCSTESILDGSTQKSQDKNLISNVNNNEKNLVLHETHEGAGPSALNVAEVVNSICALYHASNVINSHNRTADH